MKKKLLAFLVCVPFFSEAQTDIALKDLSFFHSDSDNWSIIGDVEASLTEKNLMMTTPGTGVLLCTHNSPGKWGEQYDLFTRQEFGDMDLSLEFMMAKGSNSGIYLQSRYEIQLNDSWGVTQPKYYDCGGIYQRRDLSKPDGQNQYEGYAPRYNTYKAPGLWNKMEISYKAPRFDSNGKKTGNATIIYIKLNGIIIHENVELSGPTGGTIQENEVPLAPLRFQGDHGSVAFRNITINSFDKTAGLVSDLSYRVYYGSYPSNQDMSKIKINDQGKTDILSWEVTQEQNDYVYLIDGTYYAPTDGEYTFELHNPGNSSLSLDGKMILEDQWTGGGNRVAATYLKAGNHRFEIFSNKRDGWLRPALGFWSKGPGFRLTPHHAAQSVITSAPTDPIIQNAQTNTVLRSFMDWKKNPEGPNFRLVHAVSVGSPEHIHYTYDMDSGALAQVWRGDFLDTTPMWHDRGDGSSKPLGSLTLFNHDLVLKKTDQDFSDPSSAGFKTLGYDIDDNNLPTFRYTVDGQNIQDQIRAVDGKYFEREIRMEDGSQMLARLVKGDQIKLVGSGLYVVDNHSYYIRLENDENAMIVNGNELLVAPKNNTIKYSIIF